MIRPEEKRIVATSFWYNFFFQKLPEAALEPLGAWMWPLMSRRNHRSQGSWVRLFSSLSALIRPPPFLFFFSPSSSLLSNVGFSGFFALSPHCCFGRHLSLLSLNGKENAMNTGLLTPVSAGCKQENKAMQPADDSVSKVFATQEWGPDFQAQNLHKTASNGDGCYSSRAAEAETGNPCLWPASFLQLANSGPSERPCLKRERWMVTVE